MKPYETISRYPASIRAIHARLGFKNKLPKDFTWEGPMTLFRQGWPYREEPIGEFHVVVTASKRAGKPRIFVKYKDRLVPVGRIAQAKTQPSLQDKRIRDAAHVMAGELTEEQETELGLMIAENLNLKRDAEHKDRYPTNWGTKTALGLYRTVIGQIIERLKSNESLT